MSVGSRVAVAKPRDRWRAPGETIAKAIAPPRASIDGRRPGSGAAWFLDGNRSRPLLGARGSSGQTEGRACDRGRQKSSRQPRTWPITPRRGGAAPAVPASRASGARARLDGSWWCAVKRASNRGWIVARRSGAATFARLRPGGRAVGRVSALRSEVERSAGARVVRWLQKPVRSILHAPVRGAERQTERARASTTRRPPLWRGAKRTRRANGCRICA